MLNFEYLTLRGLNEIPIVEMMMKMYRVWREENIEEEKSVENELATELKIDPVLRFVYYVLFSKGGEFLNIPEKTQIGIIKYLTAVFYSVKGTSAVFSKLHEHFGFDYENNEVVYTPTELDFKLTADSVSWVNDEIKFTDYFTDFLKELLYVGKGEILGEISTYGLDSITLDISDNVYIKTNSNIDLFRHISMRYEN